MEPFIFMFWLLLVFGVPLMLLVAAFIGYRNKVNMAKAAYCCSFGFFIHLFLAWLSITPIFFLMMAGAHTDPPGNALSPVGRLIWLAIEIVYALIYLSVCSVITGRTRPWPLPIPD